MKCITSLLKKITATGILNFLFHIAIFYKPIYLWRKKAKAKAITQYLHKSPISE